MRSNVRLQLKNKYHDLSVIFYAQFQVDRFVTHLVYIHFEAKGLIKFHPNVGRNIGLKCWDVVIHLGRTTFFFNSRMLTLAIPYQPSLQNSLSLRRYPEQYHDNNIVSLVIQWWQLLKKNTMSSHNRSHSHSSIWLSIQSQCS